MKYRMMFLAICCLFVLSMSVHGQCRIEQTVQTDEYALTGNLQYDLLGYANIDTVADVPASKRKVIFKKPYSPLRAGLFSAVIPGAGQFYTKSYWQSAAFFSAEVLLWVVYAHYLNSADGKTEEYKKYANVHWSVVRYAHWIETSGLPANYNPNLVIPEEATSGRLNDFIPEPWKYVVWDELNACENNIAENSESPTGFTHRLEHYGLQQYYEMIGKYAQFGGGWDDAWDYSGATPLPIFRSDHITTRPPNVSKRFLEYSNMRGDANSLYSIATMASYVIVANHLFSALEAAWNASRINNRIKLQGHIESRRVEGNIVEFVPTLHFEYEL